MGTNLLPKSTFICLVLYFSIISFVHGGTNLAWENVSNGIRDSALETAAASPGSPETVFVSSRRAVYKSSDSGRRWQEIFSYRGSGSGINTIALAVSDSDVIFAGTDEGLYQSTDGGSRWEKIYSGIGELEGSVLSVAVDPVNHETVYIGTGAGLYSSQDGGKTWKREHGLPQAAQVSDIAIDHTDPAIIYAAAEDGIYKRLNSGSGWEKVFFSNYAEGGAVDETGESDNQGSKLKTEVSKILIDPADNETVYAGTSEGLFISVDGGIQWSKTGSTGLLSDTLRDIIINPAEPGYVYAATDRGVFRYSGQARRWEAVYMGLSSSDIRSLALGGLAGNSNAALWAATKRGVFKTVPVIQNERAFSDAGDVEGVLDAFDHEPSIAEIREAAIRYAEVQPEKIDKWRKAAEKKAWLPSVRFAYSEGEDWQSSTYFYSTASEKYSNDDITKGNDDAWSVSLTWDLSDLVWSTDQTSIDNRSKLMVQLRDDILNEVTRLFFERRRLQYQAALSTPGAVLERIEADLRLQELTANIDALTGSYLSKRLAGHGEI